MEGDTFNVALNQDTVPGGARTIEACWGFDDADYLLSMEVPSITYSYAGGVA